MSGTKPGASNKQANIYCAVASNECCGTDKKLSMKMSKQKLASCRWMPAFSLNSYRGVSSKK